MSSNETSTTDNITQSFTDLFDFMINKALILCLTIICICVLLLIICVVIYKIVRAKKQTFLSTISSSTATANQMGFNTLQNTSQVNGDVISINKDSQSLSELRIQHEQYVNGGASSKNSNSSQGSNDSNEVEVKVKKTKSKKKRKGNNSNRSNTESSKGEEVVTPKDEVDIENELQKQMDLYKAD